MFCAEFSLKIPLATSNWQYNTIYNSFGFMIFNIYVKKHMYPHTRRIPDFFNYNMYSEYNTFENNDKNLLLQQHTPATIL